jgi:hypothetical protein
MNKAGKMQRALAVRAGLTFANKERRMRRAENQWYMPAQCIVHADNVLEGQYLNDCASIRPETALGADIDDIGFNRAALTILPNS